ncbi:MAG: group II intron reverse transcriptase/maturase, partial [Balneolaceae bacterium]|nr:group II intron reverse transcriptase/maturase [Balneolaceae bacterium]
ESLDALNKKGAPGVDGLSWSQYNEQRAERLPELLTQFKSGHYRAPAIRRAYIPKEDGKQRPLGLPTVGDKVLQGAVTRILTPIYEQLFYPNSYGFRPGKSQHQALEVLFKEVSFNGKYYIIDADMANYFGSIDHGQLRSFLDLRIKDGVVRCMIDKWLKAGVLEDGRIEYPQEGTPQGGVISPLLSNIYLHYVLDEWFIEVIQPRLKGNSALIRFADDFLLLFDNKQDAERVMKVLGKRLGKYGLTLHPEKTKLVEVNNRDRSTPSTFDFLGFTHYLGKSRKGKRILKRKTSRKKLKASLQRLNQWMKANRHKPVEQFISELNRKLQGHYGYYGITFNFPGLKHYHHCARRQLHKWLNRRGGKSKWCWEMYTGELLEQYPLKSPRIIHKCF